MRTLIQLVTKDGIKSEIREGAYGYTVKTPMRTRLSVALTGDALDGAAHLPADCRCYVMSRSETVQFLTYEEE